MEPEDQAIPTDDGSSPAPPSMGADQSQQGIPDTQSPEQVYGPGPVNNPIARAGAAVGQGLSNLANAGTDMQQQPSANPNPDEQPGGRPFPGTQLIASLLMGKGAADPTEAQKLADQFKAQGANDDQANLLAVVQAGKDGGQPAEWSMVQYNRVAANAKFAFANAAFNGINGKAPDINAAATAATQASAHILDGSSASFHVDGSGVTATVTDTEGKKTSYDMSRDQFGHFLDLSGPSQYDRLMQTGGVAGAMQALGAKPSTAPAGGDASTTSDKDQSKMQQSGAADTTSSDGTQSIVPKNSGTGKGDKSGDDDDVDADQSAKPNDYGPGKDAYNQPDDGKFRLPSPLPPGGSKAASRMGTDYFRSQTHYDSPHAQSLDAFPGNDMQFAGNSAHDNAIDAARRKRGLYAGDQEAIPGAFDKMGHYKGPDQNSGTNYGAEAEARANARFGKGNVAANPQKQEWLAKNAEAAAQRKSNMDVKIQEGKNADSRAAITGGYRVQAADTTGQHRENSTAMRVANDARNLDLKAQRLAVDQAARAATTQSKSINGIRAQHPDWDAPQILDEMAKIGTPITSTPPQVIQGVKGNPAQGGQGQDQSGDTSQAAQGKKFFNGQWYTKEEYHRHVLGQD